MSAWRCTEAPKGERREFNARVSGYDAATFLTLGGGPVHDLVLGDGLALVVLVGPRPGCLSSDDGHLHVLDLYAH